MKTQLNGINYSEQLLTDEEVAVVKAMRLGANIDVNLHRIKELSEVDEIMDLFAEFKRTGSSWIKEKDSKATGNYILFFKNMDKMTVACYMDIKKVTPPASNE